MNKEKLQTEINNLTAEYNALRYKISQLKEELNQSFNYKDMVGKCYISYHKDKYDENNSYVEIFKIISYTSDNMFEVEHGSIGGDAYIEINETKLTTAFILEKQGIDLRTYNTIMAITQHSLLAREKFVSLIQENIKNINELIGE